MDNLYHQKVISANNVFGERFLDTKTLYLYYFNSLPSVNFIGQIDGEKASESCREKFRELIVDTHRYSWYKQKQHGYQFDRTAVILKNSCVIEFCVGHCEILYSEAQQGFVEQVTKLLIQFRERKKRGPLSWIWVFFTTGRLVLGLTGNGVLINKLRQIFVSQE